MPSDFVIPDVTSEAIMIVTKLVSIATSPLSLSDISKGVQDRFKESHTRLIIAASLQLKLLQEKNSNYVVNPKYQDSVKRANKNELLPLFRQALQDYPPFLLYADLLSKDFSSVNAVNMVRGALQINSATNAVEKALRNWGISAKLIINQNGVLSIPDAEKGLPSNYVQDLLKALDSEFHAKMFLINTFGQEVYACLTTLGLDISDLAKSLIEYESDSKNSLDRSGQFFENYLIQFGTSIGIKVIGKNGVNAAVDEFFNQKKILKNQKYVANGAGGARNIGAHAVDSETGKAWAVTPQASLAITLLVPVMIRSIYLHIKNSQQVF
jgi:hypothetical protein